jgi:Protein of unknown function (DUF1329)
MSSSTICKVMLAGFAVALSLCAPRASAYAQVKPGDFITPTDASKIRDLVSPGVYYKVQRGMTMKIVTTERVDWPPPYKEATEKYSGQVSLTPDRRSLVGYVAGQPFPFLDRNDQDIGTKIIWNSVFRPVASDDYDLRFFDCDTRYQSGGGPSKQIAYFEIGHYAGYNRVGRTEVEPLPVDRDFLETNRLWAFGLYPILAPNEIRGSGFIRWRYADPSRGDDTWGLKSGGRRVRRLNESILSDSAANDTAAFSFDPDHYSGFNPKTEQYDSKFIGERNMLGSVHAEHTPEVRCATDGGTSACPEAWEMRHIYIVEATPRPGCVNALDSKTVTFVDSEMWLEPYVDTYDWNGHLFRSRIYWMAYRDRAVPEAKVAIYPFKRMFVVGAVSTDVQSNQATMCFLPGVERSQSECWYINMGAVDKFFFTVDALVRSANF